MPFRIWQLYSDFFLEYLSQRDIIPDYNNDSYRSHEKLN